MRKLFILCAMLQFSVCLQAQQYTTSVSPEVKLDGLYSMIPYGNSFIGFDVVYGKMQLAYTFKLGKLKYGIRLVKYDRAMNLVKENNLAAGDKPYGPFQPVVHKMNGRLFLLYYEMIAGAEEGNLLVKAAEIDTTSMDLRAPKTLFTIDQKNLGLFKSMDAVQSTRISLQQSNDKSKILAWWSSGLDNDLYMALLNENLDPQWSKKEVIKSPAQVGINTTCVDDQGDILMTYRITVDKEYMSHVWIYRQGKPVIDKEVKLAEGHPREMHLVASRTAPVVNIVGTYIGATDLINGAYILPLSTADFKLGKPTQTAMPDALIKLFDNDGWASTKKKHYGLSMIGVQALQLEDGSIDLVGMFRSRNALTRVVQEIAGDILVIHIKDGNAVFGRLPKHRASTGSMIGDAYYAFPYKNKTIIFYDDSESNLKQRIEETPNSSNVYKNLIMVAATMEADGTIKREKLFDMRDDNYLAVADAIRVLSPSSVIVPIRKIKGLGGIADYFKWGTIEIK
jgi:hypothetical protein